MKKVLAIIAIIAPLTLVLFTIGMKGDQPFDKRMNRILDNFAARSANLDGIITDGVDTVKYHLPVVDFPIEEYSYFDVITEHGSCEFSYVIEKWGTYEPNQKAEEYFAILERVLEKGQASGS